MYMEYIVKMEHSSIYSNQVKSIDRIVLVIQKGQHEYDFVLGENDHYERQVLDALTIYFWSFVVHTSLIL